MLPATDSLPKIKCNRSRPTCEACQLFQCPCIYGGLNGVANFGDATNKLIDAVPKKRGPKTDLLEALLKRVDGLERRLKDEKGSHPPIEEVGLVTAEERVNGDTKAKAPQLDTTSIADESVYSPTPPRLAALFLEGEHILTAPSAPSPDVQSDVLLDTYFTRCHGKVYYILDETTTRERIKLNNIPSYLLYALYAVSAR